MSQNFKPNQMTRYGNVPGVKNCLCWSIVVLHISPHGGVLGYKMLLQCMYELVLNQI